MSNLLLGVDVEGRWYVPHRCLLQILNWNFIDASPLPHPIPATY